MKKKNLLLLIVVTTIITYLTIRYLLPLFIPFILAYFIAKAVIPVSDLLHRKLHLPKMLGGSLTLFAFIGVVCIILFYLLKNLILQIQAFLKNIPIYQQMVNTYTNIICNGCDNVFGLAKGSASDFLNDNFRALTISVRTEIMPMMTEQTLAFIGRLLGFSAVFFIIFIASLMLIKDLPIYRQSYEKNPFYKEIHHILNELSNVGFAYLRAQAIITSIVTVICTTGLFLIGNSYALLIGILIALFDAIPLLGSGSILVPWAVILLLQRNFFGAAVLVTAYFASQFSRQFLESKLIGNRIGILPFYTIMAIFVGLKLFGFAGFFLGPIALVSIIAIVKYAIPILSRT